MSRSADDGTAPDGLGSLLLRFARRALGWVLSGFVAWGRTWCPDQAFEEDWSRPCPQARRARRPLGEADLRAEAVRGIAEIEYYLAVRSRH